MEFKDQGIILSVKSLGESDIVLSVFTKEHGRHQGLIKGGNARRNRGIYVIGNLVSVIWRARLDEQLGYFTCELMIPYAAGLLDDRAKLLMLAAATSLARMVLPDRQPYPLVYARLTWLFETLTDSSHISDYIMWELSLLTELGFGLDLRCCAVTGGSDDLAFVSPKSGRAVTRMVGLPYQDKLLALPRFLSETPNDKSLISNQDIKAALHLSWYFFDLYLCAPYRLSMPIARKQLVERL